MFKHESYKQNLPQKGKQQSRRQTMSDDAESKRREKKE
jgi:hypothetical protein